MNPYHKHLREAINKCTQIDDKTWELLEPHIYEKSLKKQEYFAEKGKIAKDLAYVVNGNMRHYYMRDGEEKTTYFYFENHFVAAYASCITHSPSQLTIQALTDCDLLVFPYAIMKQLYEQSHTWERFGRLLSEYLVIGLEERMTGLLMLSPEERYKNLLEGNKGKILERIPQHYIASYLGITPVSLSRIRNRRY